MSNFIRHQVIDKKRNTLVGRDEFVSASAAAASCRNEVAGDDDGRGNLARITVAVVVAIAGIICDATGGVRHPLSRVTPTRRN